MIRNSAGNAFTRQHIKAANQDQHQERSAPDPKRRVVGPLGARRAVLAFPTGGVHPRLKTRQRRPPMARVRVAARESSRASAAAKSSVPPVQRQRADWATARSVAPRQDGFAGHKIMRPIHASGSKAGFGGGSSGLSILLLKG